MIIDNKLNVYYKLTKHVVQTKNRDTAFHAHAIYKKIFIAYTTY